MSRSRLIMLFWLFAAVCGLLTLRLTQVQWIEHPRYLAQADAQHLGQAELPALRGEIRDRNNVVLATSIALYSVAVNPEEARAKLQEYKNEPDKAPEGAPTTTRELAENLAPLVNWKVDALEDVLSRPGTFAWLARKVPDETADAFKAKEKLLPGAWLAKEPTPGKRFYPKGSLASHLVGTTGIDDQGLDGLESAWDTYLAGEPGIIKAFMDRDGWATLGQPAALIRPAEPGKNVILTIDETIQYVAERELAKQVKDYKASGGIVIVMDARTGEVLAMAINPTFPAKDFGKVDPAVRRNRAITDPYEPGSTFKVFLAASAVDSGIKISDTFRAGGVLYIGGWSIHNASDGLYAGAAETLADIIAYSFNIGTASIAMRLGRDKFYKHLLAFGFGSKTGIDLVGESEGILSNGKDWAEINLATISFGQGVACTPIQLVSAMQAVANGGIRMQPRVVKAITDEQGNVVKRFEPTELGRPISPAAAADMVKVLRGVVEKGTGKKAQIPGYLVAGKTGTAQLVENGVYAPGKYVASFLGFAPADDPRVVILVKIEKPTPYWGGLVAGPVFHAVGQEALWKLGVQPDPKLLKEAENGLE
ncbi:MAG: peptidoglycan D,D-transpeptidase FtsI family protein [Vulcanimicrobiota bacterium]